MRKTHRLSARTREKCTLINIKVQKSLFVLKYDRYKGWLHSQPKASRYHRYTVQCVKWRERFFVFI